MVTSHIGPDLLATAVDFLIGKFKFAFVKAGEIVEYVREISLN